ncbi:MAG: hypothetical protein IPL09_05100 [Bacteroidetes bacterium]|jgi:hypothetical protein|nr:hypothetical protein [Bacteroidota bacterium]HMT36572.1 hypothetical protein [Chitinophagaceae bacterium]MBK7041071.1 hypothetical protein [Bacteroidota bacterium]MBK8328844.1 hypothetical protein [Bacteroidota bacterium]MBK9302166.1 hypothetical protein [Bacteroidota bacterium]
MKKKLFALATVMLLTVFLSNVYAQYYCFFVDNQSGESFYELRIRATGTNNAFSADLLPKDLIESGRHFWVKTGTDKYNTYDVKIVRLDGTPLTFTWEDVSGNMHTNKPFISVNVKDLHTLVIGSDDAGNLTFAVHNDDAYGYGHPCD